jgi:hypothetical protein
MALHLSALPEPVDKIYKRAKKDGIGYRELKKGLRRLAKKGAIIGTHVKGEPAYSKAMLAIGMFEFQAGRLTREYHEDFRQYMDEGFSEAVFTKKTGQMRTIPINEEVLPERQIGTYDGAKELVMNSKGPFAVIPCVCRDGMDLEEQSCRQSEIRETCLLLGEFAEHIGGTGVGREISREEMVGLLEQADEVGMVVIVSMFYWISVQRMRDEAALWRAADELLTFLEGTGRENVLIEIANEIDVVINHTDYDLFTPDRQAEMILALREQHPGYLYSTSGGGVNAETGRGMPSPALVEAADYVLIHGNGTRPPQLEAAIQAVRDMPAYQAHPKPIVINEDSPAVPNLDAAWRNGCSWG